MNCSEIKESCFLIVSNRTWNAGLADDLQQTIGGKWLTVRRPEELELKVLEELSPRYIFVPHWSYRIDKEITDSFEIVIFHETDLPFGRGGSPIQNLIVRGFDDTVISAIRAADELDAGDVYLKRPLSLDGAAHEIFKRANSIIKSMIVDIIEGELQPEPQTGSVTCFKRRRPEQSDLRMLNQIDKVYDYIRMLDAEGYPHAYLESDYIRYEFTRAEIIADNEIHAHVRIIKK